MRNYILKHESLNADLAILLLRLIVGGLMINHGFAKVQAYDTILPMFQGYMGMSPKLSFNMVIFAELGCGILVAIGFLTRLAIIPIFIAMAVAFFVAHGNDPFQVKELAFVFLLLSLVIFVSGGGRLSVDGLLFKSRSY